MSDEARLFLLKDRLTDLRRKKKYALTVFISTFAMGFLLGILGVLPVNNILINILISIIVGMFLMFVYTFYSYSRSEEKRIMEEIEEMAYGKNSES